MRSLESKGIGLEINIAFFAIVLTGSTASFGWEHYATENGDEIRWNSGDIRVVLDESLALLGDVNEVEEVVTDAFDEWVDEAELPVEFVFVNGRCESNFDADGVNENCISAADVGSIEQGDRAASTSVTYDVASGQIIDADMVIHLENGLWRVGESHGAYSLRAAVLHEAGHFLGMAHSEKNRSRMAPKIDPDDEPGKRGLFNDDINGASVLYGGEEFASPQDVSCSAVPVGRSATGGWSLLTVALALLAVLRKTRRV